MAEKTTPTAVPPPSKAEGSTDRVEKLFEQLADLDAKNKKAAYDAIEEYAKLMKASVDYAGRLGDEWRRIALETSRRAADVVSVWV